MDGLLELGGSSAVGKRGTCTSVLLLSLFLKASRVSFDGLSGICRLADVLRLGVVSFVNNDLKVIIGVSSGYLCGGLSAIGLL